MIAKRVSGRPTVLDEPKTRRWVHSASSRPPPRAIEDIEEMVGISSWARLVKVLRSLSRKSSTLFFYGDVTIG
jgi:hypothetical protein